MGKAPGTPHPGMKKAAPDGTAFIEKQNARLLDLTFFVIHVLAHDRVVLFHNHFFGHCTSVFLGHVKVAGIRSGIQADLDSGWLRHVVDSCIGRHSTR